MLNKWTRIALIPSLVVAGFVLWLHLADVPETQIANQTSVESNSRDSGLAAESLNRSSGGLFSAQQELVDRMFGELELLKLVHGEAEGQEAIQSMFTWLAQAPRSDASAAVTKVLASGEDAFAFGRFAPGADGFLKAYPTFRTALLDVLEMLDPAQAVEVSKAILNTSENPDEWALSLRIMSKHSESAQDEVFLQAKVQALLNKDEWLNEPSFAYLHAFDAAVQDGQFITIQRLGELVSDSPNRAVGHAATLSVDRFFQIHSDVGVSCVINQPGFLEDAAGFRATLMARVNPASPREMNAVQNYLQGNQFSDQEKRTFLETFPNFNSTYSYNLITGSLLLSRGEMRERSIAALSQLKGWLNENRYPEFEDEINNTASRLIKTWKLEL
ncbi:MAG: hypothetical protein O7C75_07525 [Verrucomicrobia bacterium]|nr:hypothetical protein [Verrucomicrobiota bacterium]